jgi:hypothetical protein
MSDSIISASPLTKDALSPTDETVIKATGLWENSHEETVQSSIFQSPGLPWHIPVQIKMPSASFNCLQSPQILWRIVSVKVRIKVRNVDSPSNILMSRLSPKFNNCFYQIEID